MTDLIERMAAAIYRQYEDRPIYAQGQMNGILVDELAKAALAAIRETHAIVPREPTDAMLEAGDSVLADPEIVRHDGSVHIVDGDVSVVYLSMIDAGEVKP